MQHLTANWILIRRESYTFERWGRKDQPARRAERDLVSKVWLWLSPCNET
jgi:hypothetical protein